MYAVEFEADVTSPYSLLKNFEQFTNQHIKVIVLAEKEPVKITSNPCYDFSDLLGKLSWSGDAVSEQRALRDEW